MKLTKKDIKAIENLGWSVEKSGSVYWLTNYSPADGDMGFEAQTKEEIIKFCDNYDPDEEFKVWYGANRGEPGSPGDLWEDCEAKGKMYQALADVLR